METRLIIAYSLIALMTTLVLIGALVLRQKRGKARRRDAGFGDHMR